jgi:hypothetical protein
MDDMNELGDPVGEMSARDEELTLTQGLLDAARDALAEAERKNDALTVELAACYRANAVAFDALVFYAKGWPNGIDGGNKARQAIDAIMAVTKQPEPVSA